MRRGVLVVWFLAVVAVGGVAWWYLFSAGSTPEGQLALGDEAAVHFLREGAQGVA